MTVKELIELILNLRVNVLLLFLCIFWIVKGFFLQLMENLWRDFGEYIKKQKGEEIMMYVNEQSKKDCQDLAERLGVKIPPEIDILVWSLPILQEMAKKIEHLEKGGYD